MDILRYGHMDIWTYGGGFLLLLLLLLQSRPSSTAQHSSRKDAGLVVVVERKNEKQARIGTSCLAEGGTEDEAAGTGRRRI